MIENRKKFKKEKEGRKKESRIRRKIYLVKEKKENRRKNAKKKERKAWKKNEKRTRIKERTKFQEIK